MITEIKQKYRSLLTILALSAGCGELHDYGNYDGSSAYSTNGGIFDAGEEQKDSGVESESFDGGLEETLVDAGTQADAGSPHYCYPTQVNPDNTPPTAVALNIYTEKNVPVEIQIQGIDPDGRINIYTILSLPRYGSLTGIEPNLIYTPNHDFLGNDSFNYKVRDDDDTDSCPAEVLIVVGSSRGEE